MFVGYWRKDEATRRAMTEDGWLHTGDVGEWVDGTHLQDHRPDEGHHHHRRRQEHLAVEIENALKASPYIKEAIVIGDGRKFLTALIGIELDTVGEWAQRRQLGYTTYRDLSPRSPRCSSWSQASSRTSTAGSPRSSRSRSSGCCPRSSTTRTVS